MDTPSADAAPQSQSNTPPADAATKTQTDTGTDSEWDDCSSDTNSDDSDAIDDGPRLNALVSALLDVFNTFYGTVATRMTAHNKLNDVVADLLNARSARNKHKRLMKRGVARLIRKGYNTAADATPQTQVATPTDPNMLDRIRETLAVNATEGYY